jgi:hypothetical protein
VLSAALTSGASGSALVKTLAPFVAISAYRFVVFSAVIAFMLVISDSKFDNDTFEAPEESSAIRLSIEFIITLPKASV